jgi:hypothetical protein
VRTSDGKKFTFLLCSCKVQKNVLFLSFLSPSCCSTALLKHLSQVSFTANLYNRVTSSLLNWLVKNFRLKLLPSFLFSFFLSFFPPYPPSLKRLFHSSPILSYLLFLCLLSSICYLCIACLPHVLNMFFPNLRILLCVFSTFSSSQQFEPFVLSGFQAKVFLWRPTVFIRILPLPPRHPARLAADCVQAIEILK